MKIGLNTDSLSALSVEQTLDFATQLGLNTVEFGLGGWSSAPPRQYRRTYRQPGRP
jgi:hypothetical protein